MKKKREIPAWTTADEKLAIDFIGSDTPRLKMPENGASPELRSPTKKERKAKLRAYIRTIHTRVWDSKVNSVRCEKYAQALLAMI